MVQPTEVLDIGKQIWDIKYQRDINNKPSLIGISWVWDGMYFAKIPTEKADLITLSDLKSYPYPKEEVLYYAFDFIPTEKSNLTAVFVAFYENKLFSFEVK